MRRKKWMTGLLAGMFALGVFAETAYAEETDNDNIAAYVGGGDAGVINTASEEKKPLLYDCGDALDIPWTTWWSNWNIGSVGADDCLEEVFGYEGTTQVSPDGSWLCYASNYTGTRSYRLMALAVNDAQKAPVKIGDDAVMHRILDDNRIVWLKGSNGTLYLSDTEGGTEAIASNVENYPFFVDASQQRVLWAERGTSKIWMRTLDLKGEAECLNWDKVAYMSSDLSILAGGRDGNVYVRDHFGEEKLFRENYDLSYFYFVQAADPYPLEAHTLADGPVGQIGESGCRYIQAAEEGAYTSIWRYDNGNISLFQKDTLAIGVHGDMVAYKKFTTEPDTSNEEQTTYLWENGKETALERQKIRSVRFSDDGSLGWGIGNTRESVFLLTEFKAEHTDGKVRVISDQLLNFVDSGLNRAYYAESDEMGVNIVLYCDQNVIDYDGTTAFVGEDSLFYYRTGQDIVFTLKVYDGTQSEVIADSVIEAKVLPNGSVLVLTSKDYVTDYGTLCLYTKEGGLKELVSGVEKIVDPDISIRWPAETVEVPQGTTGEMQLVGGAEEE